MNKTCARCEKTVYPTEELKCLDKVWHKGCFKCQECGMTLNMKTYKGYGKLPYCEAHVPKAKHTTMAETPELKRIAENTKIQSNVKYHADFEKSKGKFTQVADDPETLRIKANTKHFSNVAYHGDLEKKAHMERQRLINENGELVELPASDNYHQQIENYASEMLSTQPLANSQKNYQQSVPTVQSVQSSQPINQSNQTHRQTPTNQEYYRQPTQKYDNNDYSYNSNVALSYPPNQFPAPPAQYSNPPQNHHPNQSINANQSINSNQYSSNSNQYGSQFNNQPAQTQYPNPPKQYANTPNQNQYQGYPQQKYDDLGYAYGQYQQQNFSVGQQNKIGRIQDYDPLSDGPRHVPNTQRATTTLIYNSTDGRPKGSQTTTHHQNRAIGRVTDLDPLADEPPRPAHPPHHAPPQRVYVAMYDYEANDSDEVSFREGDLISNVSSIDGGWMTGQVLRTGLTGMLPANYVELRN